LTLSAISVAEPRSKRARHAGLVRSALRLWRTRVGVACALAVVAIAVLGPALAPHGAGEFVANPNTSPGGDALFGSDYLGQDVFSRFLLGGRSILILPFLSTVLGVGLGVIVGLTAAYARDALGDALMRVMDILLAIPQLIFALVAVAILGPEGWLIVLVVGLSTFPRVARVVRGAAVPVVEQDFVAAAEALGEPRSRILAMEILPNVTGPLIVEATLRLTYSIGTIASLAFLGFTPDPNAPNWGLMLQENRLALLIQPWGVVLPAAAIVLLTIGTGLLGDGLARASAGIDRRGVDA
jgi:peptide/nickel transport system permease protein